MNLPPIPIVDPSPPPPDKIARYTPDMILAAISIAYEKYITALTTPSDSPQLLALNSDYPNPHHAMNNDNPTNGRVKIRY